MNKVPHIFIFLGALQIPQLTGSRVLYKYELCCQAVPFTEPREGSRTPKEVMITLSLVIPREL